MRRLLFVLALLVLGCAAAPVLAAGYTITVKTDQPAYVGIAQIKINGTVSPMPGPNTAAIVVVTNPAGAAVDVEEDAVNPSTGSFGQVTVSGGGLACAGSPCWFTGTYVVNATWGGNGASATTITTFSYVVAPPATASVSCAPASFAVGASSICTAALSGGAGTTTDGEFIAFSQVGGAGKVAFPSTAICALSGNSCSLTVTGNSTGQATIQALYPGDATNPRSTATANVTVSKATTRISLECTPLASGANQFLVNSTFPCVATVSGSGAGMSGEVVTLSQIGGNGSVTLPTPASCALAIAAGQGTCLVKITGASEGNVTLRAVYGGDTDNKGSSGNTTIDVMVPVPFVACCTTTTTNSTSSSSTNSKTTTRTTTSSATTTTVGGSLPATDLLLVAIAVVLVIIGVVVTRGRTADKSAQPPTPTEGGKKECYVGVDRNPGILRGHAA